MEVDLHIPVPLVCLGLLEPVADKCFELLFLEGLGVQAGGVEGFVLLSSQRLYTQGLSLDLPPGDRVPDRGLSYRQSA